MSRFDVIWNKKNLELTIAEDAKADDNVVTEVYIPITGAPADPTHKPQPSQHIRNTAMRLGVEDFRLVTVTNGTDYIEVDRFCQEGSDEHVAREAAQSKNPKIDPRAAGIQQALAEGKAAPDAEETAEEPEGAPEQDPDAETDTDDNTVENADDQTVPVPDEGAAGNAGDGDGDDDDKADEKQAYDAITVVQLKEWLDENEVEYSSDADKQALYDLYNPS